MGVTVHEVNTRTHFKDGTLLSKRGGVLREEKLEHHHLSAERLFWALPVNGKNISYMQGHFFLELGFPVTKFRWRPHVSQEERCDYYIDIVTLEEHSVGHWHYRDLYLDVMVYEGRRADVLDTDEYLAAVAAGYLNQAEAAHALGTLHNLLNELASHGYSLGKLLKSRNIKLEWV